MIEEEKFKEKPIKRWGETKIGKRERQKWNIAAVKCVGAKTQITITTSRKPTLTFVASQRRRRKQTKMQILMNFRLVASAFYKFSEC